MLSPIPDLIASRYAVGNLIGEGAMGEVYQGVDTQTQEPIAIKALTLVNQESLTRFLREGVTLRRLNHPNIITLHETIEEEGRHYLIMDYISGGDLRKLIKKENRLALEPTLEITLSLANALVCAHRNDIVHRDLKPANILLAPDGSPRLTDFGIAYIGMAERITKLGDVLGTIIYLSPETCMGEDPDERTDIWSLGVILYEMLAGRNPFIASAPAEIFNNILKDPPPFIGVLHPDLPESVIRLIDQMLTKNRDQRIPTAEQVGVELETIIGAMYGNDEPSGMAILPPVDDDYTEFFSDPNLPSSSP